MTETSGVTAHSIVTASSTVAEPSREPVAIVGMAGRFPGAGDIDALWELLNTRGDAIGPVPPQRWDAQAPLDRDRRIQAVGGFLTGVGEFDAAFFGVSPREAADIDPQQRLMLEMAWRALEDGRVVSDALRGTRTGVYIGASWHDYEILRKQRGLGASQHSAVGTALDVIAARLSYTLGLTGPSLTVETGCSSALVGLDLAVRAIRSGDIEAALVGGVNLILAPDVSIGLTHFGGLSAGGRCAAFGADADGFVRGEGVVAIYLKPLRAALRDGDRVRAVIVETVVNNDGGGASLVTPSIDGQRDLLRRAYLARGFDIDRLGYLEAHGTGTRRGDPIEAQALGEMLGTGRSTAGGPLLIGSIKTNIGHLEAAAGIAGLVKAVLCLEHRVVPPSLHSEVPNPDIAFDDLNLRIVREHTALGAGADVHIGVNSFGWGGTNAHVVLRGADIAATLAAADPDILGFVPVSAHAAEALQQRCRDIADLVDADPTRLDAISSALGRGAPALPLRSAVLGTAPGEVARALRQHADDPSAEQASILSGRARDLGRTAFVFPGQGSQWHGLSAALYGHDPDFTAAVDACAVALRPHVDWDPVAVLSGAAGPGWLEHVDQVQPVLWALSLAIVAVWRRAGIVPDVVIGHSQGEIAAATAAGLLGIDEAARIVARRSALLRTVAGTGRMLAVELGIGEIPGAIAGFEDVVALAVHNGPTSCVLSGDTDSLEALNEILATDGVFCRMVKVDYASHSPQMDALRLPLLTEFAGIAPLRGSVEMSPGSVGILPGSVEMMSTVRVQAVVATDLSGEYWVENLCSPVRFAEAMSAVFDAGVTHVIEISPHPVLLPAVEQLAAERTDPPVALPSFYRDCDPVRELARSRARAFVAGLRPFGTGMRSNSIALPPYPLRAQSHWLPESGSAVPIGADLLRLRLYPSAIEAGAWQATVPIDLESLPWLADHQVGETVVMPGAMMAALALAATRAHLGAHPAGLSGLRFVEKLVLGIAPVRVEITLRQDFSSGVSFEIASLAADANSWTVHARGRALHTIAPAAAPLPFPVGAGESPLNAELLVADFYAACARRALNYGPDFRGVRELRRWQTGTGQCALARIVLGERAGAQAHAGELHAILLDSAMQTALALFDDERTVLPAGIAELLLDAEPAGFIDTAWAYAVRRSGTSADIHLFDAHRAPLARIMGLELVSIDNEQTASRRYDREFVLSWCRVPRDETRSSTGSFAVIGDSASTAGLAAALQRRGASAGVVNGAADSEVDTVVYLAPTEQEGLGAQRRGLIELGELVGACVRSTSTPPRLVVVTAGAQAVDSSERPDPGGALFWGFVRVVRREHPELSAEIIDLTALPHPDADRQRRFDDCAAELLARSGADQVMLRPEQRCLGQLEQGEQPEVTAPVRPWQTPAQPFRLASASGRFWEGLRYRSLEVRPPGPGEVLIEIDAAALNFIDAMKVAGTYPDDSAGRDLLGIECAGVIRAVGPEVRDRAVGERVVGCGFGALASHLTVRAEHTQPVPEAMASDLAAALPMVITTAWHALVTLARLAPDEAVLIHSGAGGLGLAAIGVARSIGARIIATAGTEERRAYLRREHGIEHVFDSRALDWADEVRAATGGRGVDVVLNSLTGVAIDLGIDVLAEDGRFIEVGKKDIYADRRLGLKPFAKGISFTAVDLAGLMTRRPERFAAALRAAWRQVGAGRLDLPPITVHDFADVASVLRDMPRGEHIGKLVLSGPETVTDIVPESLPEGRFRANGTYVITGGHGALGRSLAEYLLAQGAGAVALIGRSAPESVGSTAVRSYRADVADMKALAAVLDSIRSELPPLRGIFHAAGVLEDATVLGIDADQVERVLRPKIDGARHLDALTAADPLDLFVLFSSAAALIGNPGQSAYAAANAYLDALALARRHAGRPGLSIQWGPFAEIGLAAAQENRGARLAEQGMGSFSTGEAWTALTTFLGDERTVVGYLSFDQRQWFDAYPDAAAQVSWQVLRRSAATGPVRSAGGDFHTALAGATAADRQILVREKITEVAARVLRIPPADLDPGAPFKALGLDSLMSLELRNRLESAFTLRLSPTLLWTYGTTGTLAVAIGERLADAASGIDVTAG
ncbi:SDR family NAD(P)-dependent oxidoreductase [Nocardia sp. NPDC006630]|uniref:SDR family NAD(P)-dependent oxidoreductase n=1 Tax=Nocardia sp. NPDC006630 TaxID=3157181 RepID=UPI0033B95D63